MNRMDLLWFAQPPSVKLFLLGLLAVAIISVVRFVRLARRLFRYSGDAILPENITRGSADPYLLAECALAKRTPCEMFLDTSAHPGSFTANAERVFYILRAAETAFVYQSERCDADVGSTRSASLLTLLLSFAMVTHGAYTTLHDACNNNNSSGYGCVFRTCEQLIVTLAFGLLLCAMLYLCSSFFERKLADRKTCWKYFCSRLKDELSRDFGGRNRDTPNKP